MQNESLLVFFSASPLYEISDATTDIVKTGYQSDAKGSHGSDGPSKCGSGRILDAKAAMEDSRDEERQVSTMDQARRCTIQFSQEQQEESKRRRLGEVAVGSDRSLECSQILRVGRLFRVVRSDRLATALSQDSVCLDSQL